MKQFILIFIALLFGLNGKAQKTESKFDLRLGIGTSFLGTGDMYSIMFENEINRKLNRYFSSSIGYSYAKSDVGVFEQASFLQLNSNIYISPFSNNKNDFRLGTGLSWYAISDVYLISERYENGELINSEYRLDQRNSIGMNVIIENTYSFTDKFLMGLKLFTQFYQKGDQNTGILLKFGVKI